MSRFLKTSVTLNGNDLGQLFGFALDPASPSPFDMPAQELPGLALPGAPGLILPGTDPVVGPKTLTFSGFIVAESRTEVVANEALIKEIVASGLVEIIFSQQSTRAWYGVLQSLAVSYPSYGTTNRYARLTFTFLCPFPFAVATTSDVISFGSTAVAIPLGTAPSVGRDEWSAVIDIVGAATTPTLTELDASGNTIGTMVFTYSPAAGDHIRIDLGRKLLRRRVSGTWSSAWNYVTAGYSWPKLDPADGSVANAVYPQLKVSSGVAFITYRKMYR